MVTFESCSLWFNLLIIVVRPVLNPVPLAKQVKYLTTAKPLHTFIVSIPSHTISEEIYTTRNNYFQFFRKCVEYDNILMLLLVISLDNNLTF